jgi:hypothetical protein
MSRLLGVRPLVGPNGLNLAEWLVSVFEAGGFRGLDVSRAYTTLMSYVMGVTLAEVRWREVVTGSGQSLEEWSAAHQAEFEEVMRDHPRLADQYRLAAEKDLPAEMAVQFDYGLTAVLDGLAMRLATRGQQSAESAVSSEDTARTQAPPPSRRPGGR